MIRFIWQNWWRNKERFLLLLIGALIVGSGLSYLVGLARTNQGTIVNQLEKRWSAPYDIVVRPPGSRSVTEAKHLLEPNYLSGIAGGITLKQYHEIQKINGVKIAAPIAMIGYLRYFIPFKKLNLKNGVYRINEKNAVNIGPRIDKSSSSEYISVGPWEPKGPSYGVGASDQKLSAEVPVLLAGIDPKEEAKLVGLNHAVLKVGKSRYFNRMDQSTTQIIDATNKAKESNIPVLISNHEFVNESFTYTVQRLDLPFNNTQIANQTMEKVKAKGGKKYLDTVKATGSSQKYTFTAKKAHQLLVEGVTGINPVTKKKATSAITTDPYKDFIWMAFKPSPLQLKPITSLFPKRWPFAYENKISQDPTPVFPTVPKETYRPVKVFGKSSLKWKRIVPNWIGIYNPGKLNVSQDPLTKLPMETYRPATAKLVLNAKGKPINPPTQINPADSPYSFLTKPPTMLTTINAAAKILGNKPISAIRIKVAGVKQLNKKSENKLKRISHEIQKKTGLITDITLGSSPQPALTFIPAKGKTSALGWIQQPWLKLGSSFAIFQETNIGFSGVIASVMLVAIVYVFASLLVSLLARRKEFALLLAIGWRPRQLSKLIYLEAIMLGSFVAIVSWTVLGLVLSIHHTEISMPRLFLAGLLGLVIYGLGAIIPANLARRIRPMETLKSGETSKTARRWLRTRSLFSMGLNYMLGRWNRSLLSIASIAVPTSLLAFFLYVTFRLKGVMYTTWLGQYVALKVGPEHYFAMAIALIIAILTTAEVIWQNVTERRPEIALVKAIGWQNRSVRFLVLMEGGFTGFAAGIVGLVIAFGIIWVMYQQVPFAHIGFLLATGVIPILIGFIGAILPAEKAVRIQPSQGVKGQSINLKRTERQFRIGLGIVAVFLTAGFLTMTFTTVPQVNHQQHQNQGEKSTPTSGKVVTSSAHIHSKKQKSKDSQNMETNVTRTIPLGEVYKEQGAFVFQAKKVPFPSQSKLGKPKKGMKYISIQMMLKNTDKSSYLLYTPFYAKLHTNKGQEKAADWVVQKNTGWNQHGQHKLKNGGHVTIVLIYQVHKEAQNLKLVLPKSFAGPDLAIPIK